MSPEAGWYPDPAGSAQMRYWDGDAWTEHLQPQPAPPSWSSAPPPTVAQPPTPSPAPPPRQPRAGARPDVPPPANAPPARSRGGRGCLYGFLGGLAAVILVIVILIAAVGHAARKVSDNLAKTGNAAGAAPPAQYHLGDTAKTAGWTVIVYSFRDPHPPIDQFDTPTAGDHYVVVNLQVTNTTGRQAVFSSVIGFHLLDASNNQYTETIMPGLGPAAPDGQLAQGQSIRGNVAFQVPDGTTGLKIRIQGSITAAGAVFALP